MLQERDACGIGFVADLHGHASRYIVESSMSALARMAHRSALASDARTADGSGLLVPIPSAIFGADAHGAPNGVAVLFVRGEDPRSAVEAAAAQEGISVVDWRTPPMDDEQLGPLARSSRPQILQAILQPASEDVMRDERAALRMRRRIERTVGGTYVASCSWRTVLYKGLVAPTLLPAFYLDLADERFAAPFAVFHQRFATNTTPTWERAQPYRTLCHNGEINTIAGNQARMRARTHLGTEEAGLGPEELFHPVLDETESDSAQLDTAVELLTRGGRYIRHAIAMLVPEAWEADRAIDAEVRGFYRYNACLMEPWDGPAGIVFTDGVGVGAALDRNGLRPLRYAVAEDGVIACCSEAGAVDLAGHGRIKRGRLGPGQMIFVEPSQGVMFDADCKVRMASGAPYSAWASRLLPIEPGAPILDPPAPAELQRRQIAHGYTVEELRMVIKPMAAEAKEPTFSMGDDSPLPHMAGWPRPVHHYLKQCFAQVTNPPIDHLRERVVMSLRTLLGPRQPILTQHPEAAHLLELPSFFVLPSTLERLSDPGKSPFAAARLDATFAREAGPAGLRRAVEEICDQAHSELQSGASLLVIDNSGVSADRVPIPSLLVTGAVNNRLVDAGLRPSASLLVRADDARDVHHFACLLGYGADAICPTLALETVAAEADRSEDGGAVGTEAQENFQAAVEDGVLKIMSKMGIATVDSYRSAQIFEIAGLGADVVEACFARTPSVIGGIGWEELGSDAICRHESAGLVEPATRVKLDNPGYYRDLKRGGEHHAHNKAVVSALNRTGGVASTADEAEEDDGSDAAPAARPVRAARSSGSAARPVRPARAASAGGPKQGDSNEANGAPAPNEAATDAGMLAAHLLQRAVTTGRDDVYESFVSLVGSRPPVEVRDLLELVPAGPPVPLEEVEPASQIVKRFSTGAMSHGSLSTEAHETLAQAANLVGAMSNCGEGGEDPARYRTRGAKRDDKNSRIKQIASGRFGVTPEYCAFADELQIKIAQGSKPGEGGQLPGHKVTTEIAELRHTQPGVSLISPPPHHDIYSIEDLAQLIYDLKQVNRHAAVSVKLVAGNGVGTISSGVAKALADVIQISGCNGGTGASPLSSIKHAGMPWEVGLADAQSALVESGLRARVRLRVDGGLMTGRDVIVAALLGADEYSFGTASMMAEGCIMLRACHRDTCSTGIATQRPNLRAKFAGTPEGVAAYLMFVAQETRQLLASIGLRSLDEAIGRVECLRQRRTSDARTDSVELAPLLQPPGGPCRRHDPAASEDGLASAASALGDRLLEEGYRPVWEGDEVERRYEIANADRAIGAALSGALALEWGTGSPRGRMRAHLVGSAGQSFGAFLTHGVELFLTGEANDYVGKSMAGGTIVIRPPDDDAGEPVLAGNTCLYGATGGSAFIAGAVGERFGVRNSGAVAVVEGAGDHACEYMTGGTIVILGPVGYNLGAGMTGGEAYVWDPDLELVPRLNTALVAAIRPDSAQMGELRYLLERHRELTGSTRAAALLGNWFEFVLQVWRVAPLDRMAQLSAQLSSRVSASA